MNIAKNKKTDVGFQESHEVDSLHQADGLAMTMGTRYVHIYLRILFGH